MSDHLKLTFEKYQFWAFTAMAMILAGLLQTSIKSMREETVETRKEIVSLSHQVAILNTKLDNYDVIQKSMQSELKELNTRISVIEMKMAKFESKQH